jgi:hypothetical protein
MNKLQEELTAKLGIQFPSPDSNAGRACRHCKKREPDDATPEQKFKRCSRCRDAYYCSPECQPADWKHHKLQCAIEALATNIYLETVPTQEKAMDQLIDAYRMRVEDDCMYNGEIRGLYDGDPVPDFRSFLDLAEGRAGVYPECRTPPHFPVGYRFFQWIPADSNQHTPFLTCFNCVTVYVTPHIKCNMGIILHHFPHTFQHMAM